MKIIFLVIFIYFCSTSFAQIMYTYIEPDPVLEMEKKNKEAYFKNLRLSALKTLEKCLTACGHFDKGHTHDANNPEPCNRSGAQMQCECNCGTQSESTINDIDRREQDWLNTLQQRQKAYEDKMKQKDNLNSQTQIQQSKQYGANQQLSEQQQRYQQIQLDLDNAKNVSFNAYQQAINNGKKESGAILDATIAGAQHINDPNASLAYTGVGLGISLFTYLSEKKAEKKAKKKEKELAYEDLQNRLSIMEEERQYIIKTKKNYLIEVLKINEYNTIDLISKPRYATILLIPDEFDTNEQSIYFNYPIEIPKYSDSTYPLKDNIQKKIVNSLDQQVVYGKSIYLLYPITNLNKFTDDFVKKMGSGNVINLNANLLSFSKQPFNEQNNSDTNKDFWGNPKIETNKNLSNKKSANFWDN